MTTEAEILDAAYHRFSAEPSMRADLTEIILRLLQLELREELLEKEAKR